MPSQQVTLGTNTDISPLEEPPMTHERQTTNERQPGRSDEEDQKNKRDALPSEAAPLYVVPAPSNNLEVGQITPKLLGWKTKLWRLRYYFLGVIIIIALAIGLAVGLTERFKSITGTLNGTGVVALDFQNGSSTVTLYFQHHDGTIRETRRNEGGYSGGTKKDIVDTINPRDGTPLMALSYVSGDELIVRGTLNLGRFSVSSSPHAGLTACVNYHWYGDPFGIHLYYGSESGSVQELTYNPSIDTTWRKGYTFPDSNADGGCECTVRGLSITNVWLLNKAGQLQQRWYDYDLSANKSNHPVGTWVTQLTHPTIRPNSAISAIKFNDSNNVHYQEPSNAINELVVFGNAENSTLTNTYEVSSSPLLPGTKLASVVLNTTEGGQEIHVWGQMARHGITDFIRTFLGDNWAVAAVPVGR
ncbi:MAG: hypothetical protein M1834_005741 [Cirrosporium novae-zelandiae]|nr:MAG: hypothetical protein M1834_005741 [Cirrosporium novae-zelandiae]